MQNRRPAKSAPRSVLLLNVNSGLNGAARRVRLILDYHWTAFGWVVFNLNEVVIKAKSEKES